MSLALGSPSSRTPRIANCVELSSFVVQALQVVQVVVPEGQGPSSWGCFEGELVWLPCCHIFLKW